MTPTARDNARRLAALLPLAALALGLAACEPEPPPPEDPEANLPPAVVSLPPVPADLGQSTIPEKFADGPLTIDGLRRNRLKYLDKDVEVRATVTQVYTCPFWPDKKKPRRTVRRRKDGEPEEDPKMCQRHHFYVVDAKGKPEDRLLIVNLSALYQAKVEDEELKPGEVYTMTGRYTDAGDGFLETETGLLVLNQIKEIELAEAEKNEKKR